MSENSAEDNSYVISPVDDTDKYSKSYRNCTGLIVTGKEKGTGKNISFMSHQSPLIFSWKMPSGFQEDLAKQIQEIKDRCEDGTIDAVIVGGVYAKVKDFLEPFSGPDMFIKEYLRSVKSLSRIVKDEIGFEPLVITGPRTEPGDDHVFYDNQNRRLFLIRDKIKKTNSENEHDFDTVQGFTPSELEERMKNWKPGEWEIYRRK